MCNKNLAFSAIRNSLLNIVWMDIRLHGEINKLLTFEKMKLSHQFVVLFYVCRFTHSCL